MKQQRNKRGPAGRYWEQVKMDCYIFDIDGTLANNKHRTHHLEKTPKDWDAYHEGVDNDTPYLHLCELARELSRNTMFYVVYCTGRHDGQRAQTLNWLDEFVEAPMEQRHRLYMRKEGDHRPDHVIKLELLAQIRADGFNPLMAFDDRNSVVKMWRDAGIPCAQVAEGDF